MKNVLHMSRRRMKNIIHLAIEKLKDPYYQGAAAELAFYFLLSIVPVFILLSQVLGIFSVSLSSIKVWIDMDMLQMEGADMLLSMLDYSPSGVNSTFLAVMAVWGASRAQFSLMRMTNYTLTDGHSTGKGFLRDRIRSLRTVIITIFTIGFSLLTLVYGEAILKMAFGIVVGTEIAEKTWIMIRWPMAAILYFLMISYNYYVLPTHRVTFKSVVPGSLFASVGLMAVTAFYSLYSSYAGNYDILYGSFSNIVALMIWFYLLSWVLFFGVILNKIWWDSELIEEQSAKEEEDDLMETLRRMEGRK